MKYCLNVFMVLMLSLACSPLMAAVRSVDIKSPRDFGYVIGDVLTQRVSIVLDSPWTLDQRSVPKSDELNIWVHREVSPVRVRPVRDGKHFELDLKYQIFNVSDKPQRIVIPVHGLAVRNGQEMVRIFIPEKILTVSPVTRDGSNQSINYIKIQPPVLPLPMDEVQPFRMMWLSLLLVVASVLMLLYIWIGLPLLQRANGPFAKALRQLRAMPVSLSNESSYRLALRVVHKAMNATAGKSLVTADLPGFLAEFKGFKARSDILQDIYEASDQQFFNREGFNSPLNITELRDFCKFGRDVERGLA